MKLSQTTLDYLKNFSTINNGIVINAGNKLISMSNQRHVVGIATVPDTFPQTFGIYKLPEFLSVLSLFNEPELTFEERYVIVQSGQNKIKYYYSNPDLIKQPKRDTIPPYDSVLQELVITKENFDRLNKSAAILKLEQIGISSDGVRAFIPDNPTSNELKLDIEVTATESTERCFKIEFLKMIPDTYNVKITSGNFAVFTRENGEVEYVVAMEMN